MNTVSLALSSTLAVTGTTTLTGAATLSSTLTVSGVSTFNNEICGYNNTGSTYKRWRMFADSSSATTWLQTATYDGTATNGKLALSGMNANTLESFQVYAANSAFSGNVNISSVLSVGGGATFTCDPVIGEHLAPRITLNGTNRNMLVGIGSSGSNMGLYDMDNNYWAILALEDGKTALQSSYVGIGTITPQYQLHVNGSTFVSGLLRIGTGGSTGVYQSSDASDNWFIRTSLGAPLVVEGSAVRRGSNLGAATLGTTDYRWNALYVNSIVIGSATISYDSTNGMLKVDKGFYSEGEISAKGVDSTSSGSGSGIDISDVWASLTGNSDTFGSTVINISHIPMSDVVTDSTFTTAVSDIISDASITTENISDFSTGVASEVGKVLYSQFGFYFQDEWMVDYSGSTVSKYNYQTASISGNATNGSFITITCAAFSGRSVGDIEIIPYGFEHENPKGLFHLYPYQLDGNKLYCGLYTDGDMQWIGFKVKVYK